MDEFSLIDTYFTPFVHHRSDVVFGIGDDAACLDIPAGMQLLVSCDTLIVGVHFLSDWDPYDIAYRAVMVNVSDIAAMGGYPCWVNLALTLPSPDCAWLERFSKGLHCALKKYNITLIGGDTTCGALAMTLTIHGLVPKDHAIRRNGASVGDIIYVTGELGAAALAVLHLKIDGMNEVDKDIIMEKLLHPIPRIDFARDLSTLASAAIDISDGLSADLNHICTASQVAAALVLEAIPIHPLVKKYQGNTALDFALSGGDDYELCFTVSPTNEPLLLKRLAQSNLTCYRIGVIEAGSGLRETTLTGDSQLLEPRGYRHF